MKKLLIVLIAVGLTSCAAVDVTKTAKGSYDATNANDVEILKTKPENKPFFELGVVTATGFGASEVAKMHNAVRTKAAALGAQAVILTDEGIIKDGWSVERWATGVAIRWGQPDFE